jgi:hypothetical protein
MMLETLDHFVIVFMLMLKLLQLAMVLPKMVFECVHSFAQADELRLEDFDNGVVEDGFHGGTAVGLMRRMKMLQQSQTASYALAGGG